MGLTGKMFLPLLGTVLLCGLVLAGELNYDDVNTLPTAEKRRIIRELLRAQRDIRSALLKIHYTLNGEEFDADSNEEPYWQGCWDGELTGYRKQLETRMLSLSEGIKKANEMMEDINERVRGHGHGHGYDPSKPGYGEYGPPEYLQGYGPGDDGYGHGHPTRPPPTTPETTSYRPTTDSYAPPDDDDDYYRHRPVGGNRGRFGRELEVNDEVDEVATQAEEKEPTPEDPIDDPTVLDAMDQLVEDSFAEV